MEPLVNRIVMSPPNALMGSAAHHNVRRASDLIGYVSDPGALQRLIEAGNPIMYETYESGVPEAAGHLAYGITVLHPGKIGAEYSLTKGHYHVQRETSEIYYGLQGNGYMVMQNEQGEFRAVAIGAGEVVYVPPGWAHRSVNTGAVPLIMLFAFPADAGHDYKAILETGFRQIVVEQDGVPAIVPAPSRG
ncbi:MAG: glucose-6-phosphate isomerase family protein [Bacillota bacterium]